ncbi:MAG: ABC transporter permease [Bacteroidales bacterium]|nr:ABC transporter permease [Bacteroidales bacterium]
MERIKIGVEMELKNLRIFLLQLFVVLFLLPFSYLFIMLLAGNGNLERIQIVSLLTGYIVVTLTSAFINMLSLRITNTRQPEVLELYSTFSITFPQIVVSQCITYTLLTLPLILAAFLYVILSLESVNILLFISGIVIGIFVLLLLSVSLGLLMNNLFLANGLYQIVSVFLIIFSPSFFDMQTLNKFFQTLLLLNPITHVLNILRSPLNISLGFDVRWSYLFLFVLSVLLVLFVSKKVSKTYILEKIF